MHSSVFNVAAGLVAAFALAGTVAAQQPSAVKVDGDDITMRGCVAAESTRWQTPTEMLIWSRGGMLTAAALNDASNPLSPSGIAGRVFYWIKDDDLSRHVGQEVEVRGELEDVEIGEVEIERKDDYTEITLDLDGREETARVPHAWLRASGDDDDAEFEIVAREVDIKDVKILGACTRR